MENIMIYLTIFHIFFFLYFKIKKLQIYTCLQYYIVWQEGSGK